MIIPKFKKIRIETYKPGRSNIGKIKNTLSSFQREVSSVTKDINIENEITTKSSSKKENNKEDE